MNTRRRPLAIPGLCTLLLFIASLTASAQSISFTSSPHAPESDKASATLGVTYFYDANAEASDGSRVRYSLRFGPSGMTVDPLTGVISWRPTGEGEYDAEVQAELADNPSVSITQGWQINVSRPFSHPGCTEYDVWLPVGEGLPRPARGAAVLGRSLYVLHTLLPPQAWNSGYQISKWNGVNWTTVTSRDGDSLEVTRMIAYNGGLYVGGTSFSPERTALRKWDGTSWSEIRGLNFRSIVDMEVVGDDLYVLGVYASNGNSIIALSKWNGMNWETIHQDYDYWGIALAALNDKLYVECVPGQLGTGVDELPLLELVDGNLAPVANRALTFEKIETGQNIIPHNGTLVFLSGPILMQWNGIETRRLPAPPQSRYWPQNGISFNGDLYLSSYSYENGSSPVPAEYHFWRLNESDNIWMPVSAIQGAAIFTSQFEAQQHPGFIVYEGNLYTYDNLVESCGTPLNHIALLGTEDKCVRISGSVYHDDDRSCTPDPNEPALKGELVEILPGPHYATTNMTGAFSTLLRPGTYSLNTHPKRNWMNPCPDPVEVTLASPAATVDNVNLGTDMIPGIYDVRASVAADRPRPGFDVRYTITWWNAGTEPATGKVVFEHDNRLAFVSATSGPDRRNANLLEWDFANLPVGGSVSVTVVLNVPREIAIGTELCAFVDVELQRKEDERFLGDNRDSVCTIVRGSYDPNDIQVAPVRYDDEFDVGPLLPGDTVLSYLVRFQNTGNDTAFTVIVRDTLDPALLDVTSIQLGAASHDYEFDVSGPGILTWTFNDILLPDSGASELASHGYFKYAVHLRRGLLSLTQVSNRAAIYFDYNEPVITNTVVSVIAGTMSVEESDDANASLQVYPNPVRGTASIRLRLTERSHVRLRLVDAAGSVVAVLNDGSLNTGEQSFSFDGRGLAAGAYYLTLDVDGKKEIQPVVINR